MLELTGVGYSDEAKSALATGLSIAAGIRLLGKGCRVVAGVDEGVQGAANETQGLYNWCVTTCTLFTVALSRQIPEPSKPLVQIPPKSPPRSARENTVFVPVEAGISKRWP